MPSVWERRHQCGNGAIGMGTVPSTWEWGVKGAGCHWHGYKVLAAWEKGTGCHR